MNNGKIPRTYIVAPTETSAIAAYLATDNNLFIMQGVFTKNKEIKDKETKEYAGNGYLSTAIHEMLHWRDAQAYELSKGKITDQGEYLRYRIAQDKKMLKRLAISKKEAEQISKYASETFRIGRFDEVYAEYRTSKILKEE